VAKIREVIGADKNLAAAALKFCLKPPAVSTVIPGMRNVAQAKANCSVGNEPAMADDVEAKLRAHSWRRSFWYAGK
jgi:aryl-alcohol dehydrogenase-like predicted oxidoreductase